MAYKSLKGDLENASSNTRVPRKTFASRHWMKAVRVPKISENVTGLPLLFLPISFPDPRPGEGHGKDISFWPYVRHDLRKGRAFLGSLLCSAGWNADDQLPCNVCHAREFNMGEEVKLTITTSERFAMPVFVLQHFHKVPAVDENDKIRLNPKTNEPYYHPEMCSGKPATCKHCVEKRERYFGEMMYLDMGSGFIENLDGMDKQLSAQCVCGGILTDDGSNLTCSDGCDNPQPLSVLSGDGRAPAVVWLSKSDGEGFNTLNKANHKAATRFMVAFEEGKDSQALAVMEGDEVYWHPVIDELIKNPTFDLTTLLDPSLTPKDIPNVLKQQEAELKKHFRFQSPHSGKDYEDYAK